MQASSGHLQDRRGWLSGRKDVVDMFHGAETPTLRSACTYCDSLRCAALDKGATVAGCWGFSDLFPACQHVEAETPNSRGKSRDVNGKAKH